LWDVLVFQCTNVVAFAVAAHVTVVTYGLRDDGRDTISGVELLRRRREFALIVENADVTAVSATSLRGVVRAREGAVLVGLEIEFVALRSLVATVAFCLVLCSCKDKSSIEACLLAAAIFLNAGRIWHDWKQTR